MGWASAAAWTHAEQLLTKGKTAPGGIPILTGATQNVDIITAGDDELNVSVDMTGAVIGDLTVAVYPFEGDNSTVMPVPLTPIYAPSPVVFATGHCYYTAKFDVTGYQKVRLAIKNNNAGTQTLVYNWNLGGA